MQTTFPITELLCLEKLLHLWNFCKPGRCQRYKASAINEAGTHLEECNSSASYLTCQVATMPCSIPELENKVRQKGVMNWYPSPEYTVHLNKVMHCTVYENISVRVLSKQQAQNSVNNPEIIILVQSRLLYSRSKYSKKDVSTKFNILIVSQATITCVCFLLDKTGSEWVFH